MNIEMINAAATRLSNLVRCTPLLNSPVIDKLAGRRVWIKPECLQITGSFKFRGAWSAISALNPEVRTRGVVTFSSGNHAQGVALAAQTFGAPAIIVMPTDAPQTKIMSTKKMGAEVILSDRDRKHQEQIVAELSSERGLTIIKPFDNAEVIAGQGTIGLEIAEQARKCGVTEAEVLICCGGGGLLSGIALALEAKAPRLQCRSVEPQGFNDMARSIALGDYVRNMYTSGSICDAILTPEPGKLTFPIIRRLCGSGLVVSDEDVLRAMVIAFEQLKLVVEPGGAVALAAILFQISEIKGDDVICIISGGNVDAGVFVNALTQFGMEND
ncbi:MAG: threonine/serine dehydratase [Aestuariivita sp.]|nr:threonine/serine dehydratase [Aestuariivita sp.]